MIVATMLALYVIGEIICRIDDRKYRHYQVAVSWGSKIVMHYAKDMTQAMGWMACYPNRSTVVISSVFRGKVEFVAQRQGV